MWNEQKKNRSFYQTDGSVVPTRDVENVQFDSSGQKKKNERIVK